MKLNQKLWSLQYLYSWKSAVLLLLIAHFTVLLLMNVHIVRMEGHTVLIFKKAASLRQTYVDVRQWSAKEFLTAPEALQEYLLESQLMKVVRGVESQDWYKKMRNYLDELNRQGGSGVRSRLPE